MDKVSSKDIKKAFDDFDADKNGTMSKEEMKEFIRIMGGIWICLQPDILLCIVSILKFIFITLELLNSKTKFFHNIWL